MGRELQKKKNRSSIAKVSRRKQNIKKTKITGSLLVAAEWDKNETLAQNYKRLGLTHRLNNATGGKESKIQPRISATTATKSFAMTPSAGITEARILRSPSGRIIGVEHQAPLTLDTLDDFEPLVDDGYEKTDLVKALEERSARGIKTERMQSQREEDWIADLVEKHGNDYEAMFRDRKLNVMQQSVGDLKHRVKKWAEKQRKKTTQSSVK